MTTNRTLTLRRGENFWYHFYCVCTLGTAYFLKLVIKRAVMEAMHPGEEFTPEQAKTFIKTGDLPEEEL